METRQINTGTYKLERGELVVGKALAGRTVLSITVDGAPVQTLTLNENGFQIVEETAKAAPAAAKVAPAMVDSSANAEKVLDVGDSATVEESERRLPRRRF